MRVLGPKPVGPPARILVVQLRRIGDTLLCTPALRALKTAFPGTRLDFAAEAPADEILMGNPCVDRVWVSPRRGILSQARFMWNLRRQQYDWVIDFLTNPRSAQMTFWTGANLRLGLSRPGRQWSYTHHAVQEDGDLDMYAVEMRLSMLRGLGVADNGTQMQMFADLADPVEAARGRRIAEETPAPRVVIPVGKNHVPKRYPEDLTARLIKELGTRGLNSVLTAGPGEKRLAENVLKEGVDVPVLYDARIPTLAGAYRVCELFVGPDSAPKHVAAACGLPTVTLFALGRPTAWNDQGDPRQLVLVVPCDLRPHCDRSRCAAEQHFRRLNPVFVAEQSLAHWSRFKTR